MAATLTDFRARFPELSAYSNSRVEDALAEAASFESRSVGRQLLVAAHLVALPTGSSGGQVESVTAGSLTTRYTTDATTDNFWSKTVYGQRYQALIDVSRSFRGFVAQ